jgi:hypothetical protein
VVAFADVRVLLFNVELEPRPQKGDGTVKRFERLEQIRRLHPEKDALEIYRLSVA